MTMIERLSRLFSGTPHPYVNQEHYWPSDEIKRKAREICDMTPGSVVEIPSGWNYHMMRCVYHYVDEYKKESGKAFTYHQEGYTFAHKKYWGP